MRVFTSVVLLGALLIASPGLPQTPPAPFGEATHHVVRVDGLRFHYVTAGSGEPVVLLPGWPESWIAWRKLTPLLVKAGRQVYVLDPRGFGDSDKPQSGYDLDTAARDLHGFLAATGLIRPAGFAWYRVNFSAEGLAQAKVRAAQRLPMPVLALGGDEGVGDALRATVATIGDRVKGGAVKGSPAEGCGHFLPEECPNELAAAILGFWHETL